MTSDKEEDEFGLILVTFGVKDSTPVNNTMLINKFKFLNNNTGINLVHC